MKFLTGKARIEQTDVKRYWRLLDNELFKDKDGTIYIAPRNMVTDNFTIPMWVSWIAGSPVDFDTRCSHIHDLHCYGHEAVIVTLTEDELKEKKLLKYKPSKHMWTCEDIPEEFLKVVPKSKGQVNDILRRSMKAAGVPLGNRLRIGLGVAFNLMWYTDAWLGELVKVRLDKFYDSEFWDEVLVRGK